MVEFPIFKGRDLDLDLEPGHAAFRHASFVYVYLHTKSH